MTERVPLPPQTSIQKIVRSIDELSSSIGYIATEPKIDDTELVFSIDNYIDEKTYQEFATGLKESLKFDHEIDTEVFVIPNKYDSYEIVVKIPQSMV